MSDDHTNSQPSAERPDTPPPQAGVLGNLPRTRPAVRSPRRKEATEAASGRTRAPAGGGAAKRSTATPEDDRRSPADLEALAKGGLSVATGAASLGLRLAGRAATAVRDAVERR